MRASILKYLMMSSGKATPEITILGYFEPSPINEEGANFLPLSSSKAQEQPCPFKRACVMKWPFSKVCSPQQPLEHPTPSSAPTVSPSQFVPSSFAHPSVAITSIDQEVAESMHQLSWSGLMEVMPLSNKKVNRLLISSLMHLNHYWNVVPPTPYCPTRDVGSSSPPS